MSFSDILGGRAGEAVLSVPEMQRYARHMVMPEVGEAGQKRLKAGKILVIGTGGLGSPLLAYLAAAGVGKLGIVDFDRVDYSNLHRQILHTTSSVGMPKVESAARSIRSINPHVEVQVYEEALKAGNAIEIARDYDMIIDGTDNFATRYLTNDVCVLLDKPNVYGSIFRFDGQVTTFWAKHGPCYRCLYPEPPDPGLVPTCAEGGVLGVLPGIIGTLQAVEAIKILLHQGDLLTGRLVLFDALKMKFRELKLRKDPSCPICGTNPTIKSLIDYDQFCGTAPVDAPVRRMLAAPQIEAQALKKRLDAGEKIVILDVRDPHEFAICHLPGARLIPSKEITKRIHELDSADEIVIYCKGEMRSESAFRALQQAGFGKIVVLEGGVDAWAEEVDPSMPTY